MSGQRATSTQLRQPDPKTWEWEGQGGAAVVVVQRKLTFTGKSELTALLARTLDNALGDAGISMASIAGLLDMGTSLDGIEERFRAGDLSGEDLPDIGTLIRAVIRLVEGSPTLIEEVLYLAFDVEPENRRQFRKVALSTMSDDIGFGVIDQFMEDNLEALEGFFKRWWEQMQRTQQRFQSRRKEKSDISPTSSE